jgi:hypothetical protein
MAGLREVAFEAGIAYMKVTLPTAQDPLKIG